MDKVPSSDAFNKFPGYQYANMQGSAHVAGGGFAPMNGLNHRVGNDIAVHPTLVNPMAYTANSLDEMLEVAKTLEGQQTPIPQQYPPSHVTYHPVPTKTYDPLGIHRSMLHNDGKPACEMPIMPWEIATGNSSVSSAAPGGLILNGYVPGISFPMPTPLPMGPEFKSRSTVR